MPNSFFAGMAGGVGLSLVVAAILYALRTLADHGRRLLELEQAGKPKRNSAITARGRETAENISPYIADLVEDLNVARARIKTIEMLVAHVAQGGDPDAPPATWFQNKNRPQ